MQPHPKVAVPQPWRDCDARPNFSDNEGAPHWGHAFAERLIFAPHSRHFFIAIDQIPGLRFGGAKKIDQSTRPNNAVSSKTYSICHPPQQRFTRS
jgi:hypothetical protein